MFRILLVDDEAQERDGIRFLIEKYKLPLTVVEAQNGQKALEYLKEHPVDILFTDVKMPYKDGLELDVYQRQLLSKAGDTMEGYARAGLITSVIGLFLAAMALIFVFGIMSSSLLSGGVY